jgi:squalene-hopene/tetraprenyl-beta-curcumene cyclase
MCLVLALGPACSHPQAPPSGSWAQTAAARYLDQRETSWMSWPGAARDRGTFCVSCHTSVPYALARPSLRAALGEKTPSPNERRLLENVVKRVRLWKEVEPFYNGEGYDASKAAESRGTESVVNALILASYDASSNNQNGRLSDDTRAAFDDMWALQLTSGENKGAWMWLQFDLEPWEAGDSVYYGATLAALAVGTAPENYRSSPENQPYLDMLRDYLDRQYARQSTLNRVSLLLAAAKWPELLSNERKQGILNEVLAKQQSDGGWKLSSLQWSGDSPSALLRRWIREDGTPIGQSSDGFATAVVTFALQEGGVPRTNPAVQRGLAWLLRNQNKSEGQWASSSLNKRRDLSTNIGEFMTDAATGYAVLALTESAH